MCPCGTPPCLECNSRARALCGRYMSAHQRWVLFSYTCVGFFCFLALLAVVFSPPAARVFKQAQFRHAMSRVRSSTGEKTKKGGGSTVWVLRMPFWVPGLGDTFTTMLLMRRRILL